MENKNLLSTLVKAKQILEFITANGSVSLTEVETQLGLKRTTAFRLLYSLCELDFLVKRGKRYFLPAPLISAKEPQQLNWSAVPILKPLVDKSGLSAYIGLIFNEQIVISQVIPTASHLDDQKRLGESLPLNTTAMGKCALAFLEPQQQATILAQNTFEAKTKNTLVDRLSIQESLKVIRKQGFALDDEEKELNFRCLAVPLRQGEKLIAVLGLSGTLAELKRCDLKKLAKELTKKSQELELFLLDPR